MSITAQEFLDLVEDGKLMYKSRYSADAEVEAVEDTDDLWGELHYVKGASGYAIENIGEIEVLDSTGGMDEGSNASVTFALGNQYFRKNGYYASHYGYDWDGSFEEVVPAQKTITVYKSI